MIGRRYSRPEWASLVVLMLDLRQIWKAYVPRYTFFISDMKKASSSPLGASTAQGTVTKGLKSTSTKLLIIFLSPTPPPSHEVNYACNLKLKQNKDIYTLQHDSIKKSCVLAQQGRLFLISKYPPPAVHRAMEHQFTATPTEQDAEMPL